MKAVLASNNAHKLAEIRELLKDNFEYIYSLKELGINIEIEENGTTFEQNSLIKARAISDLLKGEYAVLADDSGICVEALNYAPGVYSARYAGEPCNDDANNALLLKNLHELEKTQPKNRRAYFCSVVVLLMPDGKHYTGEGKVYGSIIDEYRGQNGFGYDPIFFCDELNKTFAEASMQEKNTISHRSRALSALKAQL